jgi:diguanylate cyclase (GGDEF)-like protein
MEYNNAEIAPHVLNLLDSINQRISIKDKNHRYVYSNKAYWENMGFHSFDEIEMKNHHDDVNPEEIANIFIKNDNIIFDKGEKIRFEERKTNSTGTTYVMTDKFPIHDEKGQVKFIGSVIQESDVPFLNNHVLEQAISHAHCMIWYAHVHELPAKEGYDKIRFQDHTYLHWDMHAIADDAVRTWLPIEQIADVVFASSWHAAFHEDDRVRCDEHAQEALLENKTGYQQVFRVRLEDESIHWISEQVNIQKIEDGHWYLVGVCTDITSHQNFEDRLQMMSQFANCILWQADVTSNGWKFDLLAEGVARDWLGMHDEDSAKSEAVVQAFCENRSAEDMERCDRNSKTALQNGLLAYRNEFRLYDCAGAVRWMDESVNIQPLGANHWHLTGVCMDITERKKNELQLQRQVYYDTLTGLPNKEMLLQQMSQKLASELPHFTLLSLDLDNFKVINDSLGYGAGDALLLAVAGRLESLLRADDLLVRQGGDEFALLLPALPESTIKNVVERIRQALKEPIIIGARAISITASMGAMEITHEMDFSPDLILQNTNATMYQAKQQHKGEMLFFSPEITQKAMERLEMESDLRDAIAAGDLTLHYQPIVNLETGEAYHVEALVRWTHPRWGNVPPMRFIPIAEESDMILDLGECVLREACQQAVRWSEQFDRPISISVNLSMEQLQRQAIHEIIAHILTETQCPAHLLRLEVTETVMMTQADENIAKLKALQEMGIRVALDDFGTGYSSLSYLSRMPVHTLKIDRSFVASIANSVDDQAIARAIVILGQAIGAHIVAEGIETEEQAKQLQLMGCKRAQGYFFARPMPTPQAEEWLLAHNNFAQETPVLSLIKAA